MYQNNANVRAFDTTIHDNSTTRKAEDFQINQTGIDPWCHSHQFDEVHESERRSLQVLLLTAVTMALLADGWHMATHVAAFMITIVTGCEHQPNDLFPRSDHLLRFTLYHHAGGGGGGTGGEKISGAFYLHNAYATCAGWRGIFQVAQVGNKYGISLCNLEDGLP